MPQKKTYYCVAAVHRGKVSGYMSCTTQAQRAAGHLAQLQDRGMASLKIVKRASKPTGVTAPPKGARTQGRLFSEKPGGLFGPSEGHKVLKALPKGTNLRCSYDELCRWGDKMAFVTGPSVSHYVSDVERFDPEVPAREFSVWLTDIPADDRLVGQPVHFRDPKAQ